MPSTNPNRLLEFPNASLDYIISNSLKQTYDTGAFQLRDTFARAVLAETVEAGEILTTFANALYQLTTSSKSQLTNAHAQIARVMQREVVEEYVKAQSTYGRNLPPYRLRTRDAGGKLYRALSSRNMYRATYDGIGFGNINHLDRRARQWHRLNFGARPAGNYTPRTFEARFGTQVAVAFGFLGEEPSAPFAMPKGAWFEGRFFPRGRRLVNPTRGIRAWNFLDAAPRALAQRLGPAYEGVYRDWFAAAQRGVGPLVRVVAIPPLPSGLPFRAPY